MTQLKTALLCGAAALLLGACSDGSNEYHSTYFVPVNNITTYADQPLDSVHVVSYDSWTLRNTADWVTVKMQEQTNNISVSIPEGYVSYARLDLHLQPNTTGQTRSALLQVVSSYEKIGTVGNTLIQYPYLNIISPDVSTSAEGKPEFKLLVKATPSEQPAMQFIVYDEQATLTSSESWIVPSATSGFKTGEREKVTLNVTANTGSTERTATLTLTSNGISTVVNVTQAAASAN